MRRRPFLRSISVVASAGTVGCLGMGGEAIVSVQESIQVKPGTGWMEKIPDVSGPGGAISYTVRSSDRKFDVYFFTSSSAYDYYEAYTQGEEPPKTPAGHSEYSRGAVEKKGDGETYEVATKDGGAREPLEMTGPYYFVVDHSSYRMENRVDEFAEPLAAFVDLEVVKKRF